MREVRGMLRWIVEKFFYVSVGGGVLDLSGLSNRF